MYIHFRRYCFDFPCSISRRTARCVKLTCNQIIHNNIKFHNVLILWLEKNFLCGNCFAKKTILDPNRKNRVAIRQKKVSKERVADFKTCSVSVLLIASRKPHLNQTEVLYKHHTMNTIWRCHHHRKNWKQ